MDFVAYQPRGTIDHVYGEVSGCGMQDVFAWH